MGKIIVCCSILVVEGFDKLHLILYRAGVILLNINMKLMITSKYQVIWWKCEKRVGCSYQQMVLWRQMPLTGYWENRTSALIKFYIYIYMMFCLWFGPAQNILGLQFLHFSSTLSILERWNCIKGNGSPWMLADFHKAQINDFRHILAGWWFPYRSDLTF